MAFSIIEQRFPDKFKGVLEKYKQEFNKSQDGRINMKNVIPSSKGYTHAIGMIGDLIHKAQRKRKIHDLDQLKKSVEKVISIRTKQSNRNRLKNKVNKQEESIRQKHLYALKAWKSLLNKIKAVETVRDEPARVRIARVQPVRSEYISIGTVRNKRPKQNVFLAFKLTIVYLFVSIFVAIGFIREYSLILLIPLIITIIVFILASLKLLLLCRK